MTEAKIGEASHALESANDEVLGAIIESRRTHLRRRRVIMVLIQVTLVLLILAAWQFLSGTPGKDPFALVDSYYVSRPSDVAVTLWHWFATGSVWPNILATAQETIFGFLLGAALGIVGGVLLGSNKTLGGILSPFISAGNSIPRLALVPLFVIWFGLGLSSKIAFIVSIVFFLVFFSTFDGVRQRPEDLVNTLRVMGASRRQILTKLTIPVALTWVFAGLRVSVPYALVGAVTAEIVSSNVGLGYLLVTSSNQFLVSGVFASIILMVALSLVILSIVMLLQRFLPRPEVKS